VQWRREVLGIRVPGSTQSVRPGPSAASDAEDGALAEIRRCIIEPVVRSVVRDDELERLTVHWLEPAEPERVMVVLVVLGQRYELQVWVDRAEGDGRPLTNDDALNAADAFANWFEDWVCESRFGWGEQRVANYVLPDVRPDEE
jgi:hypothetical protein